MVRSLPRKLPVLVKDEIFLKGFKAEGGLTTKKIGQGWYSCTAKESQTSLGKVLWILFPVEEIREFGLALPQVWTEYENDTIDFEVDGEHEFFEKTELEAHLRRYVYP